MTARYATIAGFGIQSLPGESPTKVVNDYIEELRAAGHDISKARCKNCHTEFRWYVSLDDRTLQIYSDFEEGQQCAARQMNVHEGEV